MIPKKKFAINDPFVVSKTQLRNISILWYGFLLYSIAVVILLTNPELGAACQGIQIVSIAMMVIGGSSVMRFKFDDKYLENIFTVYLIYSVTIIGRGIKFDYNYLKNLIFDGGLGLLPYFAPLIILLPRKIGAYKKVFTTLVILGLLFIVFLVVFYKIVTNPDWLNLDSLFLTEVFAGLLALPTTYLLIMFLYQKKTVNIFALIIKLVAIYFLILRARRGSLFIASLSLVSAGLVYLIYTKRTAIVIGIGVVATIVGTVVVSGIRLPGMLTFLMARKDEDTRSGVVQYMYASMTNKDWLIGKGIDGRYFCPTVINLADNSYDRPLIETGYLQIILKGGLISLALLLAILLPAIYRGLFKSNNVLAKGAAMYILVWTISLYPTVGNGFTMMYMLVWVSVGICYSWQIRELPDIAIKNYFKRLK